MQPNKNQRLVILIVNYGTKDYLKELVKNFLFSLPRFAEMRIDWVLTDATDAFEIDREEWEKEMREEFKNHKNNYFYFFRVPNRGFSHNVNLSYQLLKKRLAENFSVTSDDLVLLLNPDTSLYWQSLSRAIQFINQNQAVKVAGLALSSPKGSLEKWGHSLSFPSLKLLWGRKRFSEPTSAVEPTEVAWVSGGAMLTRLAWWEEMKGLDESFFLYFEDVDFCKRTQLAGGKVFFLPQATVNHRRGASDINIYRRKEHFYTSEARYFYLFQSGTEYLLLRIIRLPFKVFYFFKGYCAPSFWKRQWKRLFSAVACEKAKGFPRLICSVKRVYQAPLMKELLGVSLLINLLMWGGVVWSRTFLGSPLVLHYNSYLGVDFYGDSGYLFLFPGLALMLLLFNVLVGLGLFFSRRHSALGILPAGASLAFQVAMLIILANLILINR